MTDLSRLPWPGHEEGIVHVVVETPKGYRAKFAFDEDLKAMAFQRPLPLGLSYPFDWGFIPSTLADDGGPLDAILLGDVQMAPGLVVACRILGVLEVRVFAHGKVLRNDRLVAVPHTLVAPELPDDATLLPQVLREQTERFFLAIKKDGQELAFLGWHGPQRALEHLRACADRFARSP